MIQPFALEPELVATWGQQSEYRFMHGAFALGEPRVLLALPEFEQWQRDVRKALQTASLTPIERKRVQDLLRMFARHHCRRIDVIYDAVITWLHNTEREYDRRPFRGILATENPRKHPAVLVASTLDPSDQRWSCPRGTCPARTPEAIAAELAPMLILCRVLHLVDPYFGSRRHRRVFAALMHVLADNEIVPDEIVVHCEDRGATFEYFRGEIEKMLPDLPSTVEVRFIRSRERDGQDKLHNRYVLTDLGGVSLGTGLDSGDAGQTDDLSLLSREQYQRRWAQYALDDGTFVTVDSLGPIRGTGRPRTDRRR